MMAVRVGEFFIGVKPQREWGWLVISYLFLGGGGAGLFLVAFSLGHTWAGVLGLAIVCLGTVLLLFDLGRPERFWRAFLRPRTSWISRGCLFMTLLVGAGALALAPRLPGLGFLPPAGQALWESWVGAVAVLAAVLVMLYTGFVLSVSRAIPFWNSVAFPIIFLAYSLLAGGDLLLLASRLLPGPSLDVLRLEQAQTILTAVCLLLVLGLLVLTAGGGPAARESVRLLTFGRWSGLFVGGVLGTGLLLPLVLAGPVVWIFGVRPGLVLTTLVPLLRLFGDFAFRFVVIRAGMYDPLL